MDAFLDAWSFKDYEAMYAMLDSANRKEVPRQAFAAAIESSIKDVESARVVSFDNESEDQWRARLILTGVDPKTGARKELRYTARAVHEKGEGASTEAAPKTQWRIRLPYLAPPALAQGSAVGAPTAATLLSVAAPAASSGFPESVTVDGLTLDNVLEHMAAQDNKVQTLTADIQLSGMLLGQQMNERGSLALKKPNLVKVDLGGMLVVASDGASTILYIPAAQAYATEPSQGGTLGQDLTAGFGSSAEQMKKNYQMALVGKDDANGHVAFKLAARPRKSSAFGEGIMTIWVDAATWMPVRSLFQSAMGGLDMRYANVRVNPEGLPDGAFRFQPPPEAMQLPSMPGLMGGM